MLYLSDACCAVLFGNCFARGAGAIFFFVSPNLFLNLELVARPLELSHYLFKSGVSDVDYHRVLKTLFEKRVVVGLEGDVTEEAVLQVHDLYKLDRKWYDADRC